MSYLDTLNQAWELHLEPRAEDAPTVISTFAGCGGSSLGYSIAGFRELLAVEWDDNAVKNFKLNFPGVPVYHGDIAKMSVEQYVEITGITQGELDVFDGSPPCFPSGTMISTSEGMKPIETLASGALVLTHKGRYEKVEGLQTREYAGELIMIEPRYGRDYVTCTPEHPFFVKKSVRRKSETGNARSFLEPQWLAAHELCHGDLLLELRVQQQLELVTSPVVNKQRINQQGGHLETNGTWIPIRRVYRTAPVRCLVHNLEVSGDHSYVANGYAVHNCQGFSTAGKRILDDPRNSLFREYVRLLRGLRPKVFVMENVSGMVKGKMKLIFAEIMRELKASDYCVSARLMNASHYGVPQRRERVIFIGVRNDLGIAPSHPLGRYAPISVREALQGCAPSEIIPLFGKNLEKMKLTRPGATHREKRRASLATFGKVSGFTFNRIRWDEPAPTILKTVCVSASFGSGLVMPDENRYVSITELKRLASFPDQFRLEGSFVERWARIGNSVPSLLMKSIASHIRMEILEKMKR